MITSLELAALPFNASFRSDCKMLELLHNRLLYKIYMLELVSASGVDQRRRYLYLCLSSCVVNAAWAAPRTTSAHLSHHLQTTAVIRTLPPQMSAAVSDVLGGTRLQKSNFTVYQPARSFQVRQVVVSDPDSRNTNMCTDQLLGHISHVQLTAFKVKLSNEELMNHIYLLLYLQNTIWVRNETFFS